MASGRRVVRGPSVLCAATVGVAVALGAVGCGGGDDGAAAPGPPLTIRAVPEASGTGPEAQRIREAFAALEAADLSVAGQRDGTDACELLECFTRRVSDDVTITAWGSSETAARTSDHHIGVFGVTFVASRVPRDEQDAYLQIIRRVVQQAGRPG